MHSTFLGNVKFMYQTMYSVLEIRGEVTVDSVWVNFNCWCCSITEEDAGKKDKSRWYSTWILKDEWETGVYFGVMLKITKAWQ